MKKTPLRQKIALVIFGISLSLVLTEAGLRIAGFIYLTIQEHRNQLSLKEDGYRILCMGESTTQDGYPGELNDILNNMNSGMRFSVINKGIGGTNTGIILTRLESYLEKYKPDMVITMMGANDRFFSYPVEDVFEKRKSTTIYSVNDLRIYKLLKLLKLHINEKIKKETDAKEVSRGDIESSPENVYGYVELGRSYTKQRKYYEAEKIFKRAIEVDPGDVQAYHELGLSYTEQGKYDDAEKILKKSIELDPENVRGYHELRWCYAKQPRYYEAEKMFKEAIELDPENVRAYHELGLSYSKQGRYDEAEKILKKSIELDPENKSGYIELGRCYIEQGRCDKAEEVLKKAIKFDPGHEKTKHFLLMCSQRKGSENFNVKEKRFGHYCLSTIINYRKLRDILMSRGVVLVCVEYPARDVKWLKTIIGEHKGVYCVDNKDSFIEAVEKEKYWSYFTDKFGGDFGHMTIEGKRLLSQNIADVITKECFGK